MGTLGGAHAPGATPTDPDEVAGLIPSHITLQVELNDWEAANIQAGRRWALHGKYRGNILSEDYVRKLHEHMFDKTWKWAGTFRKSEKSIGVEPSRIAVALRDLLGDVKVQSEFKHYSLEEMATRLHHRLVLVHPFPNGNGRHARLFTDVFLLRQGGKPFSWGSNVNLTKPSQVRAGYIAALQAADRKDIGPLLAFVQS